MKRALPVLSFAVFFLALAPGRAEACTCAPLKPPSEAAAEAGLVFSGEVTAIIPADPAKGFGPRRVQFKVQESFRGTKLTEVELHSNGGGSAACDFNFRVGREYLVYAYRRDEKSMWMTSTCSRTRPLREAGDDLRHLRGGLARSR